MIAAAAKFESGWHRGVGTSSCLDLTLGSVADGSTGKGVAAPCVSFQVRGGDENGTAWT